MNQIGSGRNIIKVSEPSKCAHCDKLGEFPGEVYVERDGIKLECPFSGRLCGPYCPHFQLRANNVNGWMLTLTCGRGPSMTVEHGISQ